MAVEKHYLAAIGIVGLISAIFVCAMLFLRRMSLDEKADIERNSLPAYADPNTPCIEDLDRMSRKGYDLKRIERLKLCGTIRRKLEDFELLRISACTNLRFLKMARSDFSRTGIRQINKCANLEMLYLDATNIEDDDILAFSECSRLNTLSLSYTSITDHGLSNLSSMNQLKELDLMFTHVTDDGMPHLAMLERMEVILLNGTKVTDDGLLCLLKLKGLKFIGVGRSGIHKNIRKQFLGRFPGLSIDLEYSNGIRE